MLSELGMRERNEDSIFPQADDVQGGNSVFIVCDGVGGGPGGETASSIVCGSVAAYFNTNVHNRKCLPSDIEHALAHAHKALLLFTSSNPESRNAATTLALLHIYGLEATIVHIGDSRVYHIRDGKILFRTHDHSLVNDLVSAGYITEEESRSHPKRNVITRAINWRSKNNHVDTRTISDCRSGDHFLVCSDGVLEGIDDVFISEHFRANRSPKQVVDKIDEVCRNKSKDNYSAITVLVS